METYRNAFIALSFLLAALIGGAAAREFEVGGRLGWVPPARNKDWAGKYNLFVNDALVFKYNPSVDSVVQVIAEDYNSCIITNPIGSFEDGSTVRQFSNPGHFYFVSGNFSSCRKGEKIIADVLSPGKSSRQSPARGPVKGQFWVDNVGCCQDKCCDGDFNPVCCQKET